MSGRRLLIFGATGAIGGALASHALAAGWTVIGASRRSPPAGVVDSKLAWRRYDPLTADAAAALAGEVPFDAVCWAHGANAADSLADFDADRHLALYSANVLAVLKSAASLLTAKLLAPGGARLVVVSSIWQERARTDKLSYAVTKAALGGLVRAASVDLGADGHLINAVLPGVLDTPMTRANLSPEQIDAVAGRTLHNRLPDLPTLAETILFLCSAANGSITGQSIAVDLGMSNAAVF